MSLNTMTSIKVTNSINYVDNLATMISSIASLPASLQLQKHAGWQTCYWYLLHKYMNWKTILCERWALRGFAEKLWFWELELSILWAVIASPDFQAPDLPSTRYGSSHFTFLTEHKHKHKHKQRAVNIAVELRILGSSTTGSSLSPSKQTNQLPLALLLLLRLQPFPPNPLFPQWVDFKWISLLDDQIKFMTIEYVRKTGVWLTNWSMKVIRMMLIKFIILLYLDSNGILQSTKNAQIEMPHISIIELGETNPPQNCEG